MRHSIKNSFSGFGTELLESIRENCNAKLDEASFKERIIGIEKTILALREAEVGDEKIIYLLQKHWDLCLSETEEFLRQVDSDEEK